MVGVAAKIYFKQREKQSHRKNTHIQHGVLRKQKTQHSGETGGR